MKLISNKKNSNFYNELQKLFHSCKSFYINVAFVNFSGAQLLLDSIKECEKRGVRGKVLTSTYLNFTEVKALRVLKTFSNIELKIYTSKSRGFHSKAYIFEFEDEYKVVIGSSNITASAFKSNIEWNLEVVSKRDSYFMEEIKHEFLTLFNDSHFVSEEFLKSYESFRKKSKLQEFKYEEFCKKVEKNSIQKLSCENLARLRDCGEKRALVVAATGSGKTYLSAFDVEQFRASKVLFIAHRESILLGAKRSFQKVLEEGEFGVFSSNKKELNAKYLFATIQTLSKNYKSFREDEFEYVIIDEAHHVRASSYKEILHYFKPKFLLGLTATPNRSDEKSIYEVFDDNIALDIRLQEALEMDLVSPFHYFGISDIELDYGGVDLKDIDKLAKFLSVNRRVDFIEKKIEFYGFSGKKRKALGFCVDINHAKFMSDEFNKRGFKSRYLSSKDSVAKREESIKELESDDSSLEFIFSVDIFNEGVDIPSVNLVLFLRPTNSPIVFAQQLGRGLRKSEDKEFLTILDFIGNHQKAYMIATSFFGDRGVDKESISFALKQNFANFSSSFISFDEISKKQILEQLQRKNFSSFILLKEEFLEFEDSLGLTPKLVDFFTYGVYKKALLFITESKSYFEFVNRVKKEPFDDENSLRVCRFVDSLLPLRRVEEFVILKALVFEESLGVKRCEQLIKKYKSVARVETVLNSFRFLDQEFFDVVQKKRWAKLVKFDGKRVKRSSLYERALEMDRVKKSLLDSYEFGFLLYEREFLADDYGVPFLKLYSKYSMKDIALVCELDKIHSSFRGSGQLKFRDDYFLFINLDKESCVKSRRYENIFYSKSELTWQSKPSAAQDKGDGYNLINHQSLGKKIHIFVRKYIRVDKVTQNFIYLGRANVKSYSGEKPISFVFTLESRLSDELFDEFTLGV